MGKRVPSKSDSSLVLIPCKPSKGSLLDTIMADDCATQATLMSQRRLSWASARDNQDNSQLLKSGDDHLRDSSFRRDS